MPAAPELPNTAGDVAEALSFLYTGSDPVQVGADPAAFDPQRVGGLAGLVRARDGGPLAGVTVRVLGHPEYGRTTSRADGTYDLAVNGGGILTVELSKDGYLGAQRQVVVPWNDHAAVDEVALVALDPVVSTVALDAPAGQLAQASEVTDADGTRQAALYVPAGTTATMVLPDGTRRPLSSGALRITEYTVGEQGPQAMPAPLPPASAYTYAAELSFDEALAAGASTVEFASPVYNYVTDFLGLLPGDVIPSGYYDRARGEWVAAHNGNVVEVMGVTDGLADLDVDGAQDETTPAAADGPAALAALGITDAERALIAERYPVGQVLWRVPMDHFTPYDHNFALDPDSIPPITTPDPSGEGAGSGPGSDPEQSSDDCQQSGFSVLRCESQVLTESLPVSGTPLTLNYASDRVPGPAGTAVDVQLTGAEVDPQLAAVRLVATVNGSRGQSGVQADRLETAAAPNLRHTVVWDGLDGFGRPWNGEAVLHVEITYTFDVAVQYSLGRGYGPAAFARLSVEGLDPQLAGSNRPGPGRLDLTRVRKLDIPVQVWSAPRGSQNPGGWSLSVQHRYDPRTGTVWLGDGTSYGAGSLGTPVELTRVTNLGDDVMGGGMALGPDGRVYLAEPNLHRVIRIEADGEQTVVAGDGSEDLTGDGPATEVGVGYPQDVAFRRDGTMLIAASGRVLAVSPAGQLTTFAGGGTLQGRDADRHPATEAALDYPSAVEVAPDGSVWVTETGRLRRIGTDGLIATPVTGFYGDGLTVSDEGDVWYSSGERRETSMIRADGSPYRSIDYGDYVASDNLVFEEGLRFLATMPDGSVLGTDDTGLYRWRDGDGAPTLIAGGGSDYCTSPATMIAGGATLCAVRGVLALPDGDILLVANGGVYRMQSALPRALNGETLVPSPDGSEVYVFDLRGRHLRTVDALTGGVRWVFGYDAEGRLASVTDAGGRETTVEREPDGDPTAIVAPGGERTELTADQNGWLDSVTDPSGDRTELAYGEGGLLTGLTEPSGAEHVFGYDAAGLLTTDKGPEGGVVTLERHPLAGGREVVMTDTEGRTTTYRTVTLPEGSVRRTVTYPHGGVVVNDIGADGSVTVTDLDGSTVTSRLAPDPRFGLSSPYPAEVTVTKAGQSETWNEDRSAQLSDRADPMSLTSWEDVLSRPGATSRTTFSRGDVGGTLVVTSPEGRQTTTELDEHGRRRSQQQDTLAAVVTTYDDLGRPVTRSQGDRSWTLTYDGASDRILTSTDATGAVTRFGYDPNARITRVEEPEGDVTTYGYDADGRRTTVTTADGKVHEVAYDGDDVRSGYTSPLDEIFSFTSNRMKERTGTVRPDGTRQQVVRDGTTGLVSRIDELAADGSAQGSTAMTWAGSSQTLAALTRTGVGGDEVLDLQLDGLHLTGSAFSGAADGAFTYGYDALGQLSGITFEGSTAEVEHDTDGLRTRTGPFAFDRSAAAGDVATVTDGTARLDLGYDEVGSPDRRTLAVGGTTAYDEQLERDGAGRVVKRTTVVGGATHVTGYGYDGDGRLTSVTVDGAQTESYTWSGNDRRSGSTYDDDDRPVQNGGVSYAYDANGALASRGADTFRYDGRGELLEATVGGVTVTYAYDGLGRRVARTEGGVTTEYLYGDPEDVLQVTATRTGGVLTRYWYDEEERLVGYDVGGTRRYVATDLVGTPQVVTDTSGAVVATYSWSAFGQLRSSSGPAAGELAVGLGGGVHDRVTGLVHLGMRDYDPATGSWTARDKALFDGQQTNLYLYAEGDPVNRVDRTGAASIDVGAGAGLWLGITAAVNTDGFSFCWEAGVGVGAGIEVDPVAGLDADGTKVVAEVSGNVAGLGITGKLERPVGSKCPQTSGQVKACAGVVCTTYNGDMLGGTASLAELAGAEMAAKAVVRHCMGGLW
ncbi:MAG: RHS repeat-associated core domain-containing protein [Motilibacteraceae bacterium]